MKTTLLIVLLLFSSTSYSRASGAVTIEIVTDDNGTNYILHKQGYGLDKESKTPDQIEAWLGVAIKQIGSGEPILIYSDDRTSFKTVMDMLRRFKAAGVKRFAICTGEGAYVRPVLSGTVDDIRLVTETPQSTTSQPGFPIKPPIADANPLERHPVSATVFDELEITRNGDSLRVAPAAFQKVELTVGKNMVTGVRVEKYGRNGTDVKRLSVSLQGSVESDLTADVFSHKLDRVPKKDYLIEYTITIFETDIPAQHMWAPESGKAYKVLWTRTFKELAK